MLTQEQYYQLQNQYDRTPPLNECIVSGEHYMLIAVLNELGHYPSSREEAMNKAQELLCQPYQIT